jgi:hypothetical protein
VKDIRGFLLQAEDARPAFTSGTTVVMLYRARSELQAINCRLDFRENLPCPFFSSRLSLFQLSPEMSLNWLQGSQLREMGFAASGFVATCARTRVGSF